MEPSRSKRLANGIPVSADKKEDIQKKKRKGLIVQESIGSSKNEIQRFSWLVCSTEYLL